jgi:ribosomal protein S18 acetylase RimI-like enzyme
MSGLEIQVRQADLARADDAAAVVALIDAYASEPGGRGAPLSEEAKRRLPAGLAALPTAFVLLAFAEEEAVGVAVCVEGFSTFAGRPSLNLHDLAVRPGFRSRGVGRRLLDDLTERARARGCCKVTLEVNDTNVGAKRLYERVGFGSWDAPTLFLTLALDEG